MQLQCTVLTQPQSLPLAGESVTAVIETVAIEFILNSHSVYECP
jgi:hypothetical protein